MHVSPPPMRVSPPPTRVPTPASGVLPASDHPLASVWPTGYPDVAAPALFRPPTVARVRDAQPEGRGTFSLVLLIIATIVVATDSALLTYWLTSPRLAGQVTSTSTPSP